MQVRFRRVDWEFVSPFRIAYRTRTHAQTVLLELEENDVVGRGEALGVSYHGETVDTLLDQIAAVTNDLRNGVSRTELQKLLPPGGARNAVDCALWDLEAKNAGRRAWEVAGVPSVHPLVTAYTLGVDTVDAMGKAAAAASQYSLLKIKLTGDNDVERVASIRKARPGAQLIVDANQAWSEKHLADLAPQLADLGVTLIEQPLPLGKDESLRQFKSPVPLCADESCQTAESLAAVVGKYEYANIKLDKTGGLTEALRLAHLARDAGLKLMIGCMGGSSLSMAPAFVVGQLCDVVDLDGPLLAKADVANAIRYEGSRMSIPQANLWG
jgi:L-alanine-DL-glutamate epimerase-like enolase superfamily enzyme